MSDDMPLRRYEDKPLSRWRHYCVFAIWGGLTFLAGCALQAHSAAEIRNIVISFAGGMVALVVVYGSLARQMFDNLNSVAATRGERVEELQAELASERAERKEELEAERKKRHEEISALESRYQAKIAELTAQVELLKTQYQSAVAEKAALFAELAKRSGHEKN